jgi:hypothetical protein
MRVGAHECEAAQIDTNPTPEEYEQRCNTARSRVHESGGKSPVQAAFSKLPLSSLLTSSPQMRHISPVPGILGVTFRVAQPNGSESRNPESSSALRCQIKAFKTGMLPLHLTWCHIRPDEIDRALAPRHVGAIFAAPVEPYSGNRVALTLSGYRDGSSQSCRRSVLGRPSVRDSM